MIDESALPTDRAGQARWLADREEQIAATTRAALRSIVAAAYDRFASSLTAAGDLGELDSIPGAWLTFSKDTLVNDLGEVYQAGQMTAWVGMNTQPTQAFADMWTAVANENAVSYMAGAVNRLAQVGETTWRLIRQQTVTAIAKGVPVEDLKAKIENITSFSEYRADTIARTETIGAYVQGDIAGARALGENGPVEKVWVATRDARTRPDHVGAHDQVRPLAVPFDVGGVQMDSPHAPGAPAGQVVNCRCYVELLYPGDARPDGSLVEAVPVVGAPVLMPNAV